MDIKEFISQYKNHPVLFIGAGFSYRYMDNAYNWNQLLQKVCLDLWGNQEKYLDIKARHHYHGIFRFDKIASEIEKEFNLALEHDRNGKFKDINDVFYENMNKELILSRFKIYIAKLVSEATVKDSVESELSELKKARKNIGSIITTNYDLFIEQIFDFLPLIGNNILMSNPYGAIYKIHGCVNNIEDIIITEDDYNRFNAKYELIRAQLLSIFIHNPIIFIGYGIGDDNIKQVLQTIFTYVPSNSDLAKNIRNNFLLVEYEADSTNTNVVDHEIVINSSTTIRINKVKTDDFSALYSAISDLTLPVSAMDVRKVQNIVKEINSGGSIKVHITEDIEDIKNSDKILAIGSTKTINLRYMTISEMIKEYFNIMDESNSQVLQLIDVQPISETQYFPIFGFSIINTDIKNIPKLKLQQESNLKSFIENKCTDKHCSHTTVQQILDDDSIAISYKPLYVLKAVYYDQVSLQDFETHLRSDSFNFIKSSTNFTKLICLYDMKKYADEKSF